MGPKTSTVVVTGARLVTFFVVPDRRARRSSDPPSVPGHPGGPGGRPSGGHGILPPAAGTTVPWESAGAGLFRATAYRRHMLMNAGQ